MGAAPLKLANVIKAPALASENPPKAWMEPWKLGLLRALMTLVFITWYAGDANRPHLLAFVASGF